jgi:hypothetical protein
MIVMIADKAPVEPHASDVVFPFGEPVDDVTWANALREKTRVHLRLPRNPVHAAIIIDGVGKAAFHVEGGNSGLDSLRDMLNERLSCATMPPFTRGIEIVGFGGYFNRGIARISAFVAHDVVRWGDPEDAAAAVGEHLLDLACVLPIVCINAGLVVGERICSADDVEGNRSQMREVKDGASVDAIYILADVRVHRDASGAFLRRASVDNSGPVHPGGRLSGEVVGG